MMRRKDLSPSFSVLVYVIPPTLSNANVPGDLALASLGAIYLLESSAIRDASEWAEGEKQEETNEENEAARMGERERDG